MKNKLGELTVKLDWNCRDFEKLIYFQNYGNKSTIKNNINSKEREKSNTARNKKRKFSSLLLALVTKHNFDPLRNEIAHTVHEI